MSKPLTTDDFYDVHNINYSQRSDGIIIVNQAYQTMDQFVDYKHFFDGILISIMTEGSIDANIHFQKYNIKKGDVILILPHLLVELLETSEDAHMITMGLSLDFLSNFPVLGNFITNNQVRWQPIIQMDHQSHLILEDLILLSQKVFSQNHSEKKTEVLHYLIFALLSLLSEKYLNLPNGSNLQKNRKLEIIDKFYMLVSQQAYKQQNVSFYAEKLHLTPQYLTTLLKSETGKSMIQWIDYFVITRAKFLLRSTNDPIKEISTELNFGDISLFCRYFKRNTGTTPKKFRMHYADVMN